MNGKSIETPVVTLRAIEPEDLDFLYQIENDHAIWYVSNTNEPYSRYLLHDYLSRATGDIYTDKQVRMVIVGQQGESIGMVDLQNFEPAHSRAEVGIAILDEYRCQGYGLAALCSLKAYACNVLHLHQLYAYVDANHEASLSLFSHAGFQRQVLLQDWLYSGSIYHNAYLLQCFL